MPTAVVGANGGLVGPGGGQVGPVVAVSGWQTIYAGGGRGPTVVIASGAAGG
jgi:hypothetical protein